MTALFVYLVKVNIALVVFCGGYYMVLRHLTFYTLNRVYLVCAILFATLYPLVDFSALLNRHQEIARPVQLVIINWQVPVTHAVQTAQQHNKWYWLELVFWAGVFFLAIRFITQLLSLYKLHKQSKPTQLHQYFVRAIQGDINPFSFWKSIYINPDNHEPGELKAILAHEQVHVNEWHTLDILLGELSTIFYWFNPGVWLMKKAIRENIEFITDQKILQGGSDPKTYQYSLLNVTFNGGHNAIVNHFNTSTIKKRIIMMNSKRSSPLNLTRYAVLVPAVIMLVLVFTISKAELGKQVAKGNAAIAKAFNNSVSNITPANVSSVTSVTKRRLMILPNAVSAFLTEAWSPKVIDTPKVGKILGTLDGAVITVVGYGNQKKDTVILLNDDKNRTITTAAINGRQIDLRQIKADSVNKIQGMSNYPVRGLKTGAHPLTIVDGIQSENIKDLNMNAIESVTILKEPANTTAIYGDKAKDGVIQITTKNRLLPGAAITIRGNNGLTSSGTTDKQPLIIVNGKVPEASHALTQIAAEDIESMTVLKDATAVGMYGDRAKDGAISITTKNRPAVPINHFTITTSPNVMNFNTKNIFSGKLLLVNGSETTESEVNKIPVDKIKVIKPLTGKEKTKYGDKAKNGGFEITTIK